MALGIKNMKISITSLSITALYTVMLSVANKHIRLSVTLLSIVVTFYDTQNNTTQHNGTQHKKHDNQHYNTSITALDTVMLSVTKNTLGSVSLC